MISAAAEYSNIDNFVFYDIGDGENSLKEAFGEKRIFNLNHLINSYVNRGSARRNFSMEDICRIFSIKSGIFQNKSDIIRYVFSEIEYNHSQKINDFINSSIDLVSLGTIADIMPVNNENRILVHHGIKSMGATTHPGLSLLVKRIGSRLSSRNIAWEISPLLNTPGRFGRTDLTASFFIERDAERLIALISDIDSMNSDRKKIINELLNGLYRDIENGTIDTGKNLIWINSKEIPDGLTGLIANRISELTCKPVIIVSINGRKDLVKGSGRSMGSFNFFSCVEPLSALFDRIGGHPNAFGFTADVNNLGKIEEQVEFAVSGKYQNSSLSYFDAEIPLDAVNISFISSLEQFEPHGFQNEECVFLTRNAGISEFKRFGNDRNHGKYLFFKNNGLEAIGWNMAEVMEKNFFDKKNVDILFKLELNEFNDRIFPRMLIVDID
jgi:single-stranded-DNA-specific exonuclease